MRHVLVLSRFLRHAASGVCTSFEKVCSNGYNSILLWIQERAVRAVAKLFVFPGSVWDVSLDVVNVNEDPSLASPIHCIPVTVFFKVFNTIRNTGTQHCLSSLTTMMFSNVSCSRLTTWLFGRTRVVLVASLTCEDCQRRTLSQLLKWSVTE